MAHCVLGGEEEDMWLQGEKSAWINGSSTLMLGMAQRLDS